eukprot:NODE_1249_length_936_cov_96.721879_g1203_i0.p1 GENE.NODE_1249_length_936_cov_96.721879_g1203_i0~~NODE_1249_length_936_cov_96.721879_g1203_i0.p1  ORF type:complete len:260 (+),score=33.03 NODE_1249_length_936_cov_96.721879_g1203_i0:72-851(+)
MPKRAASSDTTEAKPAKRARTEQPTGTAKGGSLQTLLTDQIKQTDWWDVLQNELNGKHFAAACAAAESAMKSETVYPPKEQILNAFLQTPFSQLKVVLIGQDPYFNAQQAMGLSFSVNDGVKIPPSLSRMYTELEGDISGFKRPSSGNLQKWANHGVLLLNATLTVQQGKANSHAKFGWQQFTDSVIQAISKNSSGVVFLLWGNFAQKKAKLVDQSKHKCILTPHPSPMSGAAWKGCKCFSKTDKALKSLGKEAVDWRL